MATTPTKTTEADDADTDLTTALPGVSRGHPEAVAGVYRLVAAIWNRLDKVENGARHYIQHHAGDLVDLDEPDAARMLKHGMVECTTDEQRSAPAANVATPLARARALNAQLGPEKAKADPSWDLHAVYPASPTPPVPSGAGASA